jgi:hypothetical protein
LFEYAITIVFLSLGILLTLKMEAVHSSKMLAVFLPDYTMPDPRRQYSSYEGHYVKGKNE